MERYVLPGNEGITDEDVEERKMEMKTDINIRFGKKHVRVVANYSVTSVLLDAFEKGLEHQGYQIDEVRMKSIKDNKRLYMIPFTKSGGLE